MLIKEFAIEPAGVGQWREFKYVFEKLGFSEGRLGVRVPDDWPQAVLEACPDDVDRKRIEELLARHAGSRLVAKPALGSAKPADWLSTVAAVHLRRRLAGAIVAPGTEVPFADPPCCVIWQEPEGFLQADRDARLPCTARELVEPLRVLLRLSPRLLIVDPYLWVERSGWKEFLSELAKACRQEGCEYLDVVTSSDRIDESSGNHEDSWLDGCFGAAGKRLRVCVRYVRARRADAALHGRYAVSDAGALHYDHGFEATGPQKRNHVSIVDSLVHRELVELYLGDLAAFEVVKELRWPKERMAFSMSKRSQVLTRD